MFINSAVQRNSAVFHLELRSSDVCVYTLAHTQHAVHKDDVDETVWVSVWTPASERQRRRRNDTKLFSSARVVRVCVRRGCCGCGHRHRRRRIHIDHNNPRDARETELVYIPRGPALPDCDVAAHATIDTRAAMSGRDEIF